MANAFLANTDTFVIWNLVLLTIGFSAVYGAAKKKAAVPVLGLWLAGVLFAFGVGSFSGIVKGFTPGGGV